MRVILLVLDSVGVGSLPDAGDYGDEGADTLGHIIESIGNIRLPNLQELGLGNIGSFQGLAPVKKPKASFGKMAECSKGKDTITGHWEMMGLILDRPFALFPEGFPAEMLDEFKKAAGLKGILGNIAASGTEIINQLGAEHLKTGYPIVYTSADSVFQIAAHEEAIPIDRLYDICEKARPICDRYLIGRVIARPFTGQIGIYTRTYNRRDYPMNPPTEMALDLMKKNDWPVVGIGKIENIYAGRGLSQSIHSEGNQDGMTQLSIELHKTGRGLILINLIDFDMLYGHRNDIQGYAGALEAFDRSLGEFLGQLKKNDLLIITADHGCDPTFPGTDHTREYVPLLVFSKERRSQDLGIRSTFADVGKSILDFFHIANMLPGRSFLS